MQAIEIVIAVACVLSILAFIVYVIGQFRLPTGQRPRTPTFNRYGEPLAPQTNPGFEETEDEKET
jgi:hypothetical protein